MSIGSYATMPPVNRAWILTGLLVAGGIGIVRIVAARPKIREDSRLLLIGDSMAEGLSPHLKALATDAALPYVGAGVQGATIERWSGSQWLGLSLEDYEPTLVLIALGTNDAFSQYTPEQVAAAMRSLMERLPPDAEIVWIGPPTLPDSYGGRSPNAAILEAVRDEAPYYFDSEDWVIPRGPDDLHPTAHGYAGWAGAIWDSLA